MWETVQLVISIVLLLLGTFFVVLGSFGIFWFRDVYLRLQASSKSLTFGFGFFILGAGVLSGDLVMFSKAVLAVTFQFLTAPIAAQVIARAAMRNGIEPAERQNPEPGPTAD